MTGSEDTSPDSESVEDPEKGFRTFEIRGLGVVDLSLPTAEDRAIWARARDAGVDSMDASIFIACILFCDEDGVRFFTQEEARSTAAEFLEGSPAYTILDLIDAVESVLADSFMKENPPN